MIFGIIAAALVFFFILPTMIMAYILYSVILVRTKPEKWGRECSMPSDRELVDMYDEGAEWAKENQECKTEVEITSDGLKLVGEYFDFGFDRAVIIIPGRMESLLYSYHFAIPYKRAGFNALVIDNRSHGLSEGKYNSLGYKEYRDIIKWSELLHDKFGNKQIVLHGVCIGSSTALFTVTDEKCPEYISAMVADGMYKNFFETFKTHMREQKKPLFPILWEVMIYVRILSGANVMTDGPYKRILKMKKPILFIHSKEDVFSLPPLTQEIYDSCPSEKKRLEWFEHGGHSRVRVNNRQKYDDLILDFTASLDYNEVCYVGNDAGIHKK